MPKDPSTDSAIAADTTAPEQATATPPPLVRIQFTARGVILNGHKKAAGRIEETSPAKAAALVADGVAKKLY
ncbi:MAG: hypothetical protein QM755_02820 [Luteolibacter sp.]